LELINGLGVDIYTIINTIHDILGLPPFVPKYNTRRGVGIKGLLDDLIAVIPLDDLKALFEQKKQTSPDFQVVIAAIQSPEFKVSIHCVYFSYVSFCLWYVHTSI
jgi:hypothetical protein